MTLIENARSLRKNQTDVERWLWQKIRNRQLLNLKFRRQFPIDRYIADFVCLELKLIIELDGSQHIEQADYDERRRACLEQRGFRIMRFWNNDVLSNGNGVLEKIQLVIMEMRGAMQ
jgi:very-short-patch-repair endonuclease